MTRKEKHYSLQYSLAHHTKKSGFLTLYKQLWNVKTVRPIEYLSNLYFEYSSC